MSVADKIARLLLDNSWQHDPKFEQAFCLAVYNLLTVWLAAQAGDLSDKHLSWAHASIDEFIKQATTSGVDEVLS